MICKKKKIKVNGKEQHPKNIVTFEAEKTLKKAAQLKHDEEMVLAVNSVDMIAKEFKKHDNCYRDYTRVIYSEFKEQQQSVYDSVNYEAVCKIIADQVIGEFKCVSMETLITAYGIGHNHPHRLKLEIIECYSNDQEVADMQKYQEIKLKGILVDIYGTDFSTSSATFCNKHQ